MLSQTFARASRSHWFRYAGYLAYLALTTGAIYALYTGWAYDDPYIAYRYVRNLVNGLGFVYNPGVRVLSATSPLYVLVLALVSLLPVDLPHLSNLIGAFCLAGGGLLLCDLAYNWKTPLAGWAGLALYPTFPLLTSTLGSEVPLYLALCLATLASYARLRYSLAAVLVALATLARPDGVLLALLLAGHVLTRSVLTRSPRSFPWRAVFWYSVILLPWVVFAWVYFGSPIPVTLAAKQYQGTMLISQRFAAGFLTTLRPFLRWPFFWLEALLAGVGFLFSFRAAQPWRLLWAWMALYFVGYTLLGVSRYFWYYAPLVPGFIAAIGLGATSLHAWARSFRSISSAAVNSVVGAAILFLFLGQLQVSWQQAGSIDRRYPVFRSIGLWLAAHTPPGSSVGALEIGVIGYYADRPIVDFAGLIQPDVTYQLLGSSSYEGAAQWAVQRYQPNYLVLRDGLFPDLETGYVAPYCQQVQHFPANSGANPHSISIYHCRSGD